MEFLILFFGSACIFFTLDGLLFGSGIRYLTGPRDFITLDQLPPAQRKALLDQVIRSACRRDKRLLIPGVILSLFWGCQATQISLINIREEAALIRLRQTQRRTGTVSDPKSIKQ
jgi:hypothetical protein